MFSGWLTTTLLGGESGKDYRYTRSFYYDVTAIEVIFSLSFNVLFISRVATVYSALSVCKLYFLCLLRFECLKFFPDLLFLFF